MGYLLGQLGGLIPIPGGIGGVDGGLVGAFVIYGQPAGASFIAVLAYRVILFWLPLLIGAIAFLSMQRKLRELEERRALRAPPAASAANPGLERPDDLGATQPTIAHGHTARLLDAKS